MSYKYHQIVVTRQGATLSLSPESCKVTGDLIVQWFFTGISSREHPIIAFTDVGPRAPFGPFAFLRQRGPVVIGKVRSGADGTFQYNALIDRPQPNVAQLDVVASTTQPASLEIELEGPSRFQTTREILVRYHEVEGQGDLTIESDNYLVMPGDPVVWRFEAPIDLFGDEPWMPVIRFTSGLTENLHSGPFADVSVLEAGDDGTTAYRVVVASGFSGARGEFPYKALIRSPYDRYRVVMSSDPRIDTDGEPADPGG